MWCAASLVNTLDRVWNAVLGVNRISTVRTLNGSLAESLSRFHLRCWAGSQIVERNVMQEKLRQLLFTRSPVTTSPAESRPTLLTCRRCDDHCQAASNAGAPQLARFPATSAFFHRYSELPEVGSFSANILQMLRNSGWNAIESASHIGDSSISSGLIPRSLLRDFVYMISLSDEHLYS